MSTPRILCMCDLSMAPEAAEALCAVGQLDCREPDQRVLEDIIDQYDVLWCHTQVQVNQDVLDRAARLRVINTASTGTNHIDVDAAIAAAEAAWVEGTWAGMSAAERAEIVAKMAQGIEDNVEMLAEIEAADVGKPYRQAAMTLGGAAGEGKYWCSLGKVLDAEQDVPVNSGGGEGGVPPAEWDVVYRRDPIGVIGLISAWNYPMNVAFRKVAPALVAGNCAILKPSEIAGLSCMFIGKLAQDADIPPGI